VAANNKSALATRRSSNAKSFFRLDQHEQPMPRQPPAQQIARTDFPIAAANSVSIISGCVSSIVRPKATAILPPNGKLAKCRPG
jgi:hypothetical protein